nr:MAG TPA: hypothetical protein [Caudoviricetes sp.]
MFVMYVEAALSAQYEFGLFLCPYIIFLASRK